MIRAKGLAAGLVVVLWMSVVATGALADGTTISEGPGAADDLWHIDVGVTFAGYGTGADAADTGAGTVRITLPGLDTSSAPGFDPATPAEPFGYSCHVGSGAYAQPGTGFECFSGASGSAFPTTMTVHILASDCYSFPPDGALQPALAEVWAAPGETGPPDASVPLTFNAPCTTGKGPDEPIQAPLPCLVPKLRGLTLAAARAKIQDGGCRLGRVRRVPSAKVKPGRVVSQSPAPGRKLAAHAKVSLVLAKRA